MKWKFVIKGSKCKSKPKISSETHQSLRNAFDRHPKTHILPGDVWMNSNHWRCFTELGALDHFRALTKIISLKSKNCFLIHFFFLFFLKQRNLWMDAYNSVAKSLYAMPPCWLSKQKQKRWVGHEDNRTLPSLPCQHQHIERQDWVWKVHQPPEERC